jgi:23S rRNA-/tRNA-specific pseudouridylate synthase
VHSSEKKRFAGFPPPLLGPVPLRLRVLHARDGHAVLEKPAGVPWERSALDAPSGVVEALREQLDAGKPELLALGLCRPASVWPLETELAGPGLLASSGEALARWRNAFGSEQLRFYFEFLAADAGLDDSFECSLPVAQHVGKPVALVSRNTGKKSMTFFRRVQRAGDWSWWEAVSTYPRYHQVRLHAAESGLRIVGESLYADGGVLTLAGLLPRHRLNKGDDRPLHDGICLRLASVDCTGAGVDGWTTLTASEPEKWTALRKRQAAQCGRQA